MYDLVGHTALTVHDLMSEKEIVAALEYFGWTTTPAYRADVVVFENGTSNVELRLRQGGGFVDAGIYSNLQASGEVYENGQFSDVAMAKARVLFWLEKWAGFDLFESTNSVDDLM